MEDLELKNKKVNEYNKELELKLEKYKEKIIKQENEIELLKQTLKSREKTLGDIEKRLSSMAPGVDKEIDKLTEKLSNCTSETKKKKLLKEIQVLKEKRTVIRMLYIEKMIEILHYEKNKTFSFSSEKIDKHVLVNETEHVAEEGFENTIKVDIPKDKGKKNVKRRVKGQKDNKLKNLEYETKEYKLDDNSNKCSKCGRAMSAIGFSSRREIIEIPAKIIVIEHKIYAYKCNYCSKDQGKDVIVRASAPKAWIPRSECTPELLSNIIYRKFACHLPYNRIEDMYEAQGLTLSRQLMANWVVQHGTVFKEMTEVLKTNLLKKNFLHADETYIQVLREPDKPPRSQSYYWMYRTDKYEEHPIIIFDYKDNRRKENPEGFLKGFKGYLCADGYASYKKIENVTVCQCWAHARRKFVDLINKKTGTCKDIRVKEGFEYIQKLYAIEKEAKEMTIKDRFEYREKHATKILSEFLAWLKKNYHENDSSLANEAVYYCLKNWTELTNYLNDGRIALDNNLAENTIRPVVIGRKNYLFYASVKGVEISASIYSVLSTAKEHNLNIYKYIELLLKEGRKIEEDSPRDFDTIEDLVPWNPKVQELCGFKNK